MPVDRQRMINASVIGCTGLALAASSPFAPKLIPVPRGVSASSVEVAIPRALVGGVDGAVGLGLLGLSADEFRRALQRTPDEIARDDQHRENVLMNHAMLGRITQLDRGSTLPQQFTQALSSRSALEEHATALIFAIRRLESKSRNALLTAVSPALRQQAFLKQRLENQHAEVMAMLRAQSPSDLENAVPPRLRPTPNMRPLLPAPETAKADAERLVTSLYAKGPERAMLYERQTHELLRGSSNRFELNTALVTSQAACVARGEAQRDELAASIRRVQEEINRGEASRAAANTEHYLELVDDHAEAEHDLGRQREVLDNLRHSQADEDRMKTSLERAAQAIDAQHHRLNTNRIVNLLNHPRHDEHAVERGDSIELREIVVVR